jgi:hypothetical protein
VFKQGISKTLSATAPRRDVVRARTLSVRACELPNARRPRPTRLPLGRRRAPRRPSLPTPRASPSLRHTRAVHAEDRQSVRGPIVHALAEERHTMVASWQSSPRRHRRPSPALFKAPAFSSRRTAAPPRRHGRRLGELLPAPVHKAVHARTCLPSDLLPLSEPRLAPPAPPSRLQPGRSSRRRPMPPTELTGATSAQTSATPAP